MKIMENCTMVHVKLESDSIYGDIKELDIAVEYPPIWNDDEYELWKKDLYQTVYNMYNRYGYWDKVTITQAIYIHETGTGNMYIEHIAEV